MRGAPGPPPRDHYMYHPQQYIRAQQDHLIHSGQTARGTFGQRYVINDLVWKFFFYIFLILYTMFCLQSSSIVTGAGDPKDLTTNADAGIAGTVTGNIAAQVVASNAIAMRSSAVAVPHSLQSPQDQRATGKFFANAKHD